MSTSSLSPLPSSASTTMSTSTSRPPTVTFPFPTPSLPFPLTQSSLYLVPIDKIDANNIPLDATEFLTTESLAMGVTPSLSSTLSSSSSSSSLSSSSSPTPSSSSSLLTLEPLRPILLTTYTQSPPHDYGFRGACSLCHCTHFHHKSAEDMTISSNNDGIHKGEHPLNTHHNQPKILTSLVYSHVDCECSHSNSYHLPLLSPSAVTEITQKYKEKTPQNTQSSRYLSYQNSQLSTYLSLSQQKLRAKVKAKYNVFPCTVEECECAKFLQHDQYNMVNPSMIWDNQDEMQNNQNNNKDNKDNNPDDVILPNAIRPVEMLSDGSLRAFDGRTFEEDKLEKLKIEIKKYLKIESKMGDENDNKYNKKDNNPLSQEEKISPPSHLPPLHPLSRFHSLIYRSIPPGLVDIPLPTSPIESDIKNHLKRYQAMNNDNGTTTNYGNRSESARGKESNSSGDIVIPTLPSSLPFPYFHPPSSSPSPSHPHPYSLDSLLLSPPLPLTPLTSSLHNLTVDIPLKHSVENEYQKKYHQHMTGDNGEGNSVGSPSPPHLSPPPSSFPLTLSSSHISNPNPPSLLPLPYSSLHSFPYSFHDSLLPLPRVCRRCHHSEHHHVKEDEEQKGKWKSKGKGKGKAVSVKSEKKGKESGKEKGKTVSKTNK